MTVRPVERILADLEHTAARERLLRDELDRATLDDGTVLFMAALRAREAALAGAHNEQQHTGPGDHR